MQKRQVGQGFVNNNNNVVGKVHPNRRRRRSGGTNRGRKNNLLYRLFHPFKWRTRPKRNNSNRQISSQRRSLDLDNHVPKVTPPTSLSDVRLQRPFLQLATQPSNKDTISPNNINNPFLSARHKLPPPPPVITLPPKPSPPPIITLPPKTVKPSSSAATPSLSSQYNILKPLDASLKHVYSIQEDSVITHVFRSVPDAKFVKAPEIKSNSEAMQPMVISLPSSATFSSTSSSSGKSQIKSLPNSNRFNAIPTTGALEKVNSGPTLALPAISPTSDAKIIENRFPFSHESVTPSAFSDILFPTSSPPVIVSKRQQENYINNNINNQSPFSSSQALSLSSSSSALSHDKSFASSSLNPSLAIPRKNQPLRAFAAVQQNIPFNQQNIFQQNHPSSSSSFPSSENVVGTRQVVVDGFPAGLPSGTPEGVVIALASARNRK